MRTECTFLVHIGAFLSTAYGRILNWCVQNVPFGCRQTHSKYIHLDACKRCVLFCAIS